ncbi:hypothetical protein JXO59_13320, partial [candidate division KSB1 bacterium]|nr:hypothetical protein [candidate division KSB1 bacterium]
MKTIKIMLLLLIIIGSWSSIIFSQENHQLGKYKIIINNDGAMTIVEQPIDSILNKNANVPFRVESQTSDPLPNLVPFEGAQPPNSFSYDEGTRRVQISMNIRNMGAVKSENAIVGWFLTRDGESTEEYRYCLGIDYIPPLEPFAPPTYDYFTAVCDVVNDLVFVVPPGIYYFAYFIDYLNVIIESNERDNYGYWRDPALIVKPNLILTLWAYDDHIDFQYDPLTHVCTYKYHFTNNGLVAIENEINIGFYLSDDKIFSPKKDLRIGSTKIEPLEAGESRGNTFQVCLDDVENLQSGIYYGGVFADYTFDVDEINENDNGMLFDETQVDWLGNLEPQVISITPDSSENKGVITISNLMGSGFDVGATVFLHKEHEANIFAHEVHVENVNNINCKFDLFNAKTGTWDVIVENPNGKTSGNSGIGLFKIYGSLPDGLVVTNTDDSGIGSLREAILLANSNIGADTIQFAIPKSDPGFDISSGVWTISPLNPLPWVTDDSTVILGSSQTSFAGDLNLEGPEIQLAGSLASDTTCGFYLQSAYNKLQGFVINNFHASGVLIWGE